jgi:DNA-binding XRE family transcriptional regulator
MHPLLEPVRITTDAILRYKGIQRWGIERGDLDQRLFEEMEKLRVLTFDVEQFPTVSPRTKRAEAGAWQGDRLFDIVKVERYEHPSGKRIEVAWSVRAGQWAYYWLNAQGRVYLARMAKALLELDHQGTALSKKLGQRIVLLANAVSQLRNLRIDGLLEDVGELPSPERRHRNWAGRMRERFDEAMLELQKAGIFTHVVWPDGHGPGDARRHKGWTEDWLRSHVQISLPEISKIAGDVAPVRREAVASVAKPTELKGERLRQFRCKLGWKQNRLADHLSISRKHLSQIENDRCVASAELDGKISAWFREYEDMMSMEAQP